MSKLPPVFIGSSSEGEAWAEAVRFHLDRRDVPCRMWSMGVFAQGDLTMEALEREMRECSFVVLVATKDDMTRKRGTAKLAPRDNVILEYGMGLGRLGRDRTFLLVPNDFAMHLPSDLAGLTLGSFRHDPAAGLQARRSAMRPVADEIFERVEQMEFLHPPIDGTEVDDLLASVSRHLRDFGARGRADVDAWTQAVVNTVQERFVTPAEDAYATWLRPDADGRLRVARSCNLPRDYVDAGWGRDEGLVGRAWVQGTAEVVSELADHPHFVRREGCESESYVCACVGAPGGHGGVLAVGSDAGFREAPGDIGFITTYAAVLALQLDPGGSAESLAGVLADGAKLPGRVLRAWRS